jgi:protein-arginine kinase activator protein McsA
MIYMLNTDIKCECGKPATLHMLTIQYGNHTEVHHCDSCECKVQDASKRWSTFKTEDTK